MSRSNDTSSASDGTAAIIWAMPTTHPAPGTVNVSPPVGAWAMLNTVDSSAKALRMHQSHFASRIGVPLMAFIHSDALAVSIGPSVLNGNSAANHQSSPRMSMAAENWAT